MEGEILLITLNNHIATITWEIRIFLSIELIPLEQLR